MSVITQRKNNIIICSLNCEGIRRSSDYICDILKSTSCDILCLQETWTMDSNLEHLFNTFLYFKVILYTIYTEITFNLFCDLFTHLFPLLVLYKNIYNILSIYLLFYSRPLVSH